MLVNRRQIQIESEEESRHCGWTTMVLEEIERNAGETIVEGEEWR